MEQLEGEVVVVDDDVEVEVLGALVEVVVVVVMETLSMQTS